MTPIRGAVGVSFDHSQHIIIIYNLPFSLYLHIHIHNI